MAKLTLNQQMSFKEMLYDFRTHVSSELERIRPFSEKKKSNISAYIEALNEVKKLSDALDHTFFYGNDQLKNIPEDVACGKISEIVTLTRSGLDFVNNVEFSSEAPLNLDDNTAATHAENMAKIVKLSSELPILGYNQLALYFAAIAIVLLVAAVLAPFTAGISLPAAGIVIAALGGTSGVAMGLGGAGIVSAVMAGKIGFFDTGVADVAKGLTLTPRVVVPDAASSANSAVPDEKGESKLESH